MVLKLENINNLISDDLAKRNENWTEIDNTFSLKADKTYVDNQGTAIKLIAHRGYSATAPENTLPAFELAKKMGLKYVECDVSWTIDNVPVLIHDDTIDRTSDGTGSVSAMSLDQLRLYDFGSWKSAEYNNTKIPTFEEFILACKKLGLHPYIEIKTRINEAKANILINIIKKYEMLRNVSWISFYTSDLSLVLSKDSFARIGLLTSSMSEIKITEAVNLKTQNNLVFIDAEQSTITKELIDSANTQGLTVEAWTVNTELNAFCFIRLGVIGITTDNLIIDGVYAYKENTIGYYKMNEISGTTIADGSGNGVDATAVGGIAITDALVTDGGKSRTGNGADGFIDIPVNLSGRSNFKLSFYFKLNEIQTGYRSLLNAYRNQFGVGVGLYIVTNGTWLNYRLNTQTGTTAEASSLVTPEVGGVYKVEMEYIAGKLTFKVYSVVNGVATLLKSNNHVIGGNLNTDIRDIRLLASNGMSASEYSTATIDHLEISTVEQ